MSSESNFFHSTPGMSIRSKLSTEIHCLPRVTPGLLAALARVVPAKELMKVDLPTLGMPTTITRMAAPTMPRLRRRASRAALISSTLFCKAPRRSGGFSGLGHLDK